MRIICFIIGLTWVTYNCSKIISLLVFLLINFIIISKSNGSFFYINFTDLVIAMRKTNMDKNATIDNNQSW